MLTSIQIIPMYGQFLCYCKADCSEATTYSLCRGDNNFRSHCRWSSGACLLDCGSYSATSCPVESRQCSAEDGGCGAAPTTEAPTTTAAAPTTEAPTTTAAPTTVTSEVPEVPSSSITSLWPSTVNPSAAPVTMPTQVPDAVFIVDSHLVLSGNFGRMIADGSVKDDIRDALRADLAKKLVISAEMIEIVALSPRSSSTTEEEGQLLVNFTIQTSNLSSVKEKVQRMPNSDPAKELTETLLVYEKSGGLRKDFRLLAAGVDDFEQKTSTEIPVRNPGDGVPPPSVPSGLIGGVVAGVMMAAVIVVAVLLLRNRSPSGTGATMNNLRGRAFSSLHDEMELSEKAHDELFGQESTATHAATDHEMSLL